MCDKTWRLTTFNCLQLNPHLEATLSSKQGNRAVVLPRQTAPALAATTTGISSFAFQGTNAHAILQWPSASQPSALAASTSAPTWKKKHFSVLPPMHTCLHAVRAVAPAFKGSACTFEWLLHQQSSAFLCDHMVQGRAIVPAAAYLELFTAAAAAVTAGLPSSGSSAGFTALTGAVFEAPLLLSTGSKQQAVTLCCSLDMALGYCKLASHTQTQTTQHMQGSIQVLQSHGLHVQSASSQQPPGLLRLMSSLLSKDEQRPVSGQAIGSMMCSSELSDGFYIHPAVLDNSLQLAGAAAQARAAANSPDAEQATATGTVFVPATLEAFSPLGKLPISSIHATASLGSASANAQDGIVCHHGLSTAGKQMLQLQGMKSKAIKGRAVPKPVGTALQGTPQMLYEITWQANSATTAQAHPLASNIVSLRTSSSTQVCAPALKLASIMQTVSRSQGSRVCLQMQTASGRSPVSALTAGTNVDQAAMWAVLRTFQQECPQIPMAGVDADGASDAQVHLSAAPGPVRASDGYGVTFSNGAEYNARLLPAIPTEGLLGARSGEGLPDLAGGSVVITGGTGMIGSLVCNWILEHAKPRSVELLSRTGRASSDRLQTILGSEQAQAGAMVSITMCDVSFREDSASCFGNTSSTNSTYSSSSSGFRRSYTPCSAVIHAGGVVADATVGNQTPGSMRAVFAPKVIAAQHMQQALQQQPVTRQVLFSSVSALLGAPGQLNYAAANAAMDSMAGGWQGEGRGGVSSIQWGGWAGGGMAGADPTTASRLARMGMPLIQPQQGLAALEAVLNRHSMHSMGGLNQSLPVVAAVAFQWQSFMRNIPPTQPGIFAEFESLTLPQQESVTAPHSIRPAQSMAPLVAATAKAASKASSKVLQQVTSAVTASLGQAVASDASLMEAGLDSLSQVELRNSLSQLFEIELSATFTFDYPNIAAMAKYISEMIGEPQQVADSSSNAQRAALTRGRTTLQVSTQPIRQKVPAPVASADSQQDEVDAQCQAEAGAIAAVQSPLSRQNQMQASTHALESSAAIKHQVGSAVAAVLGTPISADASLMEAGLDSLSSVELRNALSQTFSLDLPATFTFDYPNITAMAGYISSARGGDGGVEEVIRSAAVPQMSHMTMTAPAGSVPEAVQAITGVSVR